jgi:hypothetical protein
MFQTLDDKNECIGVYIDGRLVYPESVNDSLTSTWEYSQFLKNKDIDYAKLYCGGKNLAEVCPQAYSEEWNEINSRMKAFLVSFKEAKISLRENCFYDLVPERFLLEYCYLKDKICDHVFENYEKPNNYKFLVDLTKFADRIKYNSLNVDPRNLNLGTSKSRDFYKKISNSQQYIEYDIFGTKTGRLTTTKNSFPILTMNKEYRQVLKPKNDFFIELDYNAVELRILMSLLGMKQPKKDLHNHIKNTVFNNNYTRDQSKQKVFAWLYNPAAKNFSLDRAFSKKAVLQKYYDGTSVTTPFGRKIESDDHHALNYIIQSTASDFFLRKVLELEENISSLDSEIVFCIHDSVVLDVNSAELESLQEAVRLFGQTPFGEFKINISAGENFGNMQQKN